MRRKQEQRSLSESTQMHENNDMGTRNKLILPTFSILIELKNGHNLSPLPISCIKLSIMSGDHCTCILAIALRIPCIVADYNVIIACIVLLSLSPMVSLSNAFFGGFLSNLLASLYGSLFQTRACFLQY